MEETRLSILTRNPETFDLIKENLVYSGLKEKSRLNPFIKKLPGIYKYLLVPYGEPSETAKFVKENSDMAILDMNTYPIHTYGKDFNFLGAMAELKETDGIRVVMHYIADTPDMHINEIHEKIPFFEIFNDPAFKNANIKTYKNMAKLLSLGAKL